MSSVAGPENKGSTARMARKPQRFPGAVAAADPDRAAVIGVRTGFQQTFAELDDAANRLSRLLRASGLRPGDHISILLENHDRYLEVLWGCHYAGLTYTAVSSRFTSDEVSFLLRDSGARALVTSVALEAVASGAVATAQPLEVKLMLDGSAPGFIRYEEAVAGHPARPLDEPRTAGMSMLYSSGTSGQPTAISHPYVARPLETAPAGWSWAARKVFGIDHGATFLSVAPLYHSGPLGFALGATALGATVLVMDRFDPEQFLEAVQRNGVTHTFVVPTMMRRLLRVPGDAKVAYSTAALQKVIHAAEPCPVPVKQAMIDWLGPVLVEFYSGTEANGMVYCDSLEWLQHPGTVGKPFNCTVHICDEERNELPTGETGVIYFGDSGVEFEYKDDGSKTRGRRTEEGWTSLGDVGYVDADGYLYLTDRQSNLIISGGVNIYPQETENHLSTHAQVADVAVIGVPHDDFGEQVIAVVQPEAMPATDAESAALENELIAYCRATLADLKCPRRVEFRTELPREPTGKLLKRVLKDEYWQRSGRRI